LTSTGGITLKKEKGFSASLRYRYIDSRPANEDNTVTAKGYFLLDAVAAYRTGNIEFGLSAQNLLNTAWNEAQFDTESRLQNESMPVSELHFTPGTPFFMKGSITVRF
jgi:outer membrane receptor protein involved in Fe transport